MKEKSMKGKEWFLLNYLRFFLEMALLLFIPPTYKLDSEFKYY